MLSIFENKHKICLKINKVYLKILIDQLIKCQILIVSFPNFWRSDVSISMFHRCVFILLIIEHMYFWSIFVSYNKQENFFFPKNYIHTFNTWHSMHIFYQLCVQVQALRMATLWQKCWRVWHYPSHTSQDHTSVGSALRNDPSDIVCTVNFGYVRW